MSNFKAKMHQIQRRLGLRPRPCCESLQRSLDPLTGFRGPTSKGSGGEGGSGRRREVPSTFFLGIYENVCDRRCGGDVSGADVEGQGLPTVTWSQIPGE